MDSASYSLPIKGALSHRKLIFLADHQAMSQQPTPRTLNRLEICSKLSLAQVSPISTDPRRHHLPLKPVPLYHQPVLWSPFSRPPFPACLCPPSPPIFHPTQSNLPRPPPVHNVPAVNLKLLKIEQAQTNLKWSILLCDFQKLFVLTCSDLSNHEKYCDFQTLISDNMLL